MNKESVLLCLRNYFECIEVHDEVTPELLTLIAGSGIEQRFFQIIVMQLKLLLDLGVAAVHCKNFESLGGGLFSMKQKISSANIRILYSFLPNQRPVLLCAFYERAGKSKTDYARYIAVASERLKQFKEEM